MSRKFPLMIILLLFVIGSSLWWSSFVTLCDEFPLMIIFVTLYDEEFPLMIIYYLDDQRFFDYYMLPLWWGVPFDDYATFMMIHMYSLMKEVSFVYHLLPFITRSSLDDHCYPLLMRISFWWSYVTFIVRSTLWWSYITWWSVTIDDCIIWYPPW